MLQDAPLALCFVPRVVGPVDLVHAGVERGQHARRGRIAAPGAFRANEQGADRHDRQIEAERESLCDARRGAKSGERAGARAERDGVAIGERQAGFVEKFADRGQKPRAGDGAGLLVTDPRARPGLHVAGCASTAADNSATEQNSVEVSRARSTV